MKLALIRRKFSSSGGAELYLQRLMDALVDAGHSLHLFTESWEGLGAKIQVHVIPTAARRSQRPIQFAIRVDQELARLQFDCVFSLERTIKQDVYRAGDGLHRMWLQRRREFSPWWKKPFIGLGGFHRNMVALEARTFDPGNTRYIIANSEMVRREIIENFQFPAGRIVLIRNGIDTQRFQRGNREATRARFGIRETDYVLLFAGSGWERKGLRYLIRALEPLDDPGVKLLVIGKGKKPWRTPSNVIFAGTMPDIENAYAAADLFTFPPIYEPSSNVVIEALASGLPVVTSALNGAAEFLEPGITGSVVDNPANIRALAEAIRFWRSKPGRLTPSNPDRLSMTRNVRETVALLERVARDKTPA